jgi:sugar phosphate isomerase/epimerase
MKSVSLIILLISILHPLLAKEPYPLHVYGTTGGLENSTIKSVKLLAKHGYTGVITDEKAFSKYKRAGLSNKNLNIAAHYMRYDFAKEKSDARIRKNIDLLAGTNIDLWIIFKISDGVQVPKKDFIAFMKGVLPYAHKKKVRIALYPHIGKPNLFDRADQVIPIVNEMNHPNLGICIHLYHERDKANSWGQLFQQAKEKVFAVTVTDWQKNTKTGDVQYSPLVNDGEDLLKSYMKTIVASGYDGYIAWLSWKVDKMSGKSPEQYLGPSIKTWNDLCQEVALGK